MKINQSFNNIEKSNLLIEGKQFSIDITPHAFQVLSGGMYKDRIGAIIRELSCNAWDSHVEAQNTKQPFDIFIPSKLSPVFYIRDYGTGLTKDEIETIYTCYFKSTKADTNKQLGCFGLGSKTPLSYTDQFSVTSCKDGKKYLYLVMPGCWRSGNVIKWGVGRTLWSAVAPVRAPILLLSIKQRGLLQGMPEMDKVSLVDMAMLSVSPLS